ncbi:MAG: hypothetical protein J6W00_14655 [Lentisphaeria bacterium]|nr:hypothetical protein [Lentisphaeria bacterium]
MVYCEFEYQLNCSWNWNRTRQRLSACTTAAAKDWVKAHYGSNAGCIAIRNLKAI